MSLLDYGISQLTQHSTEMSPTYPSKAPKRPLGHHVIRLMTVTLIDMGGVCQLQVHPSTEMENQLAHCLLCVEFVWYMGKCDDEDIVPWRVLFDRMCEITPSAYHAKHIFISCHLLCSLEILDLVADDFLLSSSESSFSLFPVWAVTVANDAGGAGTPDMIDLTTGGDSMARAAVPHSHTSRITPSLNGKGTIARPAESFGVSLVDALFTLLRRQFATTLPTEEPPGRKSVDVDLDQLWSFAWAFPSILCHMDNLTTMSTVDWRRSRDNGAEALSTRAVDATISFLVDAMTAAPSRTAPHSSPSTVDSVVSQFCVYGCAACVLHTLMLRRRRQRTPFDCRKTTDEVAIYTALARTLVGVRSGTRRLHGSESDRDVADSRRCILAALAYYFPSTTLQTSLSKIIHEMLCS